MLILLCRKLNKPTMEELAWYDHRPIYDEKEQLVGRMSNARWLHGWIVVEVEAICLGEGDGIPAVLP